jgi:hypothetical protein
MNPELDDDNLTPEQWKEVYSHLVNIDDHMDPSMAAQYAASIYTVEPVFEFPTGAPERLRELTGQGRRDAFEITIKDLLVRARREGYKVAGSLDCVQWVTHATLLARLAVAGDAGSGAKVGWHFQSPKGPMTFWIKSVKHTRWLKFHLRVALKPKHH